MSGEVETEDRFASGYQAARRHYLHNTDVIRRSAEAWGDPEQDRSRKVIRQVWPDLAAALDAAAAAAETTKGLDQSWVVVGDEVKSTPCATAS